MDGIHDLGGMHGFGAVPAADPFEPLFRDPWEERVFALTMAMGKRGIWTADEERHAIELIPSDQYLAMSYYERWVAGLERLMGEYGLLGSDGGEDRSARSLVGGHSLAAPCRLTGNGTTMMAAPVPPAFAVGDKVKARNIHPAGHTRLPRYVRGRVGTVERFHGHHALPDASAHGLGARLGPLYGVVFDAAELWGEEDAPAGLEGVHLDLWQSYLEPL